MLPKLTFRPLEGWPDELTKSRKPAAFKATYTQTLKDLEHELRAINARDVFLYLDVGPGAVRNDGLLRADARPGHPGVVLTFHFWNQDPKDPVRLYCDTYTGWQDNLRAITKALEALRGIDRWGVTRRKQQYAGFSTLVKAPSPTIAKVSTPAPSELFASQGEAIRYLAFVAESRHWSVDLNNAAGIKEACRMAEESAASPAQMALVKAAIAIVRGVSR